MGEQDILLAIKEQLGRIESDVQNIKETQQKEHAKSERADEQLATKLEEYFEYAKNRQDSIRDSLLADIGDVRAAIGYNQLTDPETGKIKPIASRLEALETRKERTIAKWWDRISEKLVYAILVAALIVLLKWLQAPPEITNLIH